MLGISFRRIGIATPVLCETRSSGGKRRANARVVEAKPSSRGTWSRFAASAVRRPRVKALFVELTWRWRRGQPRETASARAAVRRCRRVGRLGRLGKRGRQSAAEVPAAARCGNGLPCDVKTVVDARCAGACHGAPPAFGAPMSLVTWQDFQRAGAEKRLDQSLSVGGRSHPSHRRRPHAGDRFAHHERDEHPRRVDRRRRSRRRQLRRASSLQGWRHGEATAGYPTCRSTTTPRASRSARTGSKSRATKTPFDTSTLFLPPNEFYACFNFTSPWKNPVQGIPVRDHHRQLGNAAPLAPLPDHAPRHRQRSFVMCDGQHPLQALVTGWAPGNQDSARCRPMSASSSRPPRATTFSSSTTAIPRASRSRTRAASVFAHPPSFAPRRHPSPGRAPRRINVPPRAAGQRER